MIQDDIAAKAAPRHVPSQQNVYREADRINEGDRSKLTSNSDTKPLIALFNQCFLNRFNAELIKGDDEPIYLPANVERKTNQVIFAHGYFASALHEISHWCIAGEARRRLEDYGYWYEPDGRDAMQQAEFEKVEVKPQAIEWIFSASCGRGFQVSCDNLNGVETCRHQFTEKVLAQVAVYLEKGLPARAQQFSDALTAYYGTSPLDISMFS